MSPNYHDDQAGPAVLDIERLMEALAQRTTARITKESLSLEVALEIREAFPDSKLLVGVPLEAGEDDIEVDILGLVNDRKLAVRVTNGTGSRDDCLKALADIRRLCAVEPNLAGLVLAIVHDREAPESIGEPWPAWRTCPPGAGDGRAHLNYAYMWVALGAMLG